MSKRGSIYKQICQEIIKIGNLFPDFSIARFIRNENVTIEDGKGFHANLKAYRERLELDNHVVCDDEETQKIMDEGLRIQSILAKEQLYGKD
jgi:type II secretory pathway component PulF